MRFLIDENLPAAVAELLRDAGHDAVAVAESPYRSALDPELWAVASRERRVLVTRDLGFPHPVGRASPPGVVLIRLPSRCRKNAIVAAVRSLLEAVAPHELLGHITVVEPARLRRRSMSRLRR